MLESLIRAVGATRPEGDLVEGKDGIYLKPVGSHETNPFPPAVERRVQSGEQGVYLEPVGGYDTDPFAAQDAPLRERIVERGDTVKQFEHRILDVRMWEYDRQSLEAKARELDKWGLDGFELVSVWKGYAFLKRGVSVTIAEAAWKRVKKIAC